VRGGEREKERKAPLMGDAAHPRNTYNTWACESVAALVCVLQRHINEVSFRPPFRFLITFLPEEEINITVKRRKRITI